jgi:hypothetical protein
MGRICDRADIKNIMLRMLRMWGVNGRLTPANGQFSWGSVWREDCNGCPVIVREGGGAVERVDDSNVDNNDDCHGNMFHGVMRMNTDLVFLRRGGVHLNRRGNKG